MQDTQRRVLLEKVNREVNKRVTYKSDLALYGRADLWVLPGKYGDCEDYALEKRNKLIQLGFDPMELRLAICYTELGEGHAVLTVDLGQETYILDNRFDEIKTYNSLKRYGYKFVARQRNNQWVKIK